MRFQFLKEDYKRDLENNNIKSDSINKAIIDAMDAEDKDSEEVDVQEQPEAEETEQPVEEQPMEEQQPQEEEIHEALDTVSDKDIKKSLEDTDVKLEESKQLRESDEYTEDEAYLAILDAEGDEETAKEIYESGDYSFYPDIYDWTELAENVIDEIYGGPENLDKQTLEIYFDYEKLGRDLSFDSYESDEQDEDGDYIEISAGEYWCGDENATDEEIGEAFVDEVGIAGVSHPDYYFDYEAYGRDLSFDNFYMTDYGIIEIY